MRRPGTRLALAFVVICLPILGYLAWWVPLGEVPDEASHIVRADSLRHAQFLGGRQATTDRLGNPVLQAGFMANFALLPVSFVFGPRPLSEKVLTPDLLRKQRAIPWQDHPSFVNMPNTAQYMPLFYVPSALGLAVAQSAGIFPYDAVRWGRIANGLAYLAVGVAAVLVARRGIRLGFVVLTLPMSLSLGGSFNQDGLVIAACVLAAALLTRPQQRASFWTASTLLAAVLAAKPPYLPLAGLPAAAMLLAASSRPDWRRAALGCAIAFLPGLIWMLVTSRTVATEYILGTPAPGGPLWTGDPARVFGTTDRLEQTRILLRDPLLMVTLPVRAMATAGMQLIREMIGVLGTLDVVLPEVDYRIWFAAIPLALAADRITTGAPEAQSWPWAGLAVVWICLVAALFAVYLSQYITWTPVGLDRLEGVQGRYLLPILAFAGMALPHWHIRPPARIGTAMALAIEAGLMATAVASAGILHTTVLAAWYRN